jgi:hypothetical protein
MELNINNMDSYGSIKDEDLTDCFTPFRLGGDYKGINIDSINYSVINRVINTSLSVCRNLKESDFIGINITMGKTIKRHIPFFNDTPEKIDAELKEYIAGSIDCGHIPEGLKSKNKGFNDITLNKCIEDIESNFYVKVIDTKICINDIQYRAFILSTVKCIKNLMGDNIKAQELTDKKYSMRDKPGIFKNELNIKILIKILNKANRIYKKDSPRVIFTDILIGILKNIKIYSEAYYEQEKINKNKNEIKRKFKEMMEKEEKASIRRKNKREKELKEFRAWRRKNNRHIILKNKIENAKKELSRLEGESQVEMEELRIWRKKSYKIKKRLKKLKKKS